MRHRAVIVGATGYTGQELAQLLLAHPGFEIAGLFGSGRLGERQDFVRTAPSFRGVLDVSVDPATPDAIVSAEPRIVFLATPHEVSMALAPQLLRADPDLSVVDLSGAFRLRDAALYTTHYGFEHRSPELLAEAVYGLPEVDRTDLPGARLVACAGCYVTAASIPLAALGRAGLLATGSTPVIDATSGVSGAGRGAKLGTSFCEVSQSAYGVFTHRHRPEIEQTVGRRVVFQPHLGPYERGILATIHATLGGGVTSADVTAAMEAAFETECFVRLLGPVGDGTPLPSVAAVARTNVIDLAWAVEGDHLVVFSAIDNLVKGASGQAVQCANVVLGLEEAAGLFPCGTRLRAAAMAGSGA